MEIYVFDNSFEGFLTLIFDYLPALQPALLPMLENRSK